MRNLDTLPLLLASALVFVAGCGDKNGASPSSSASGKKAPSSGTSKPTAPASAVVSASAAPASPAEAPIEATLADHDQTVKVKFTPPAKWQKDPMGAREDSVVFQGGWMSTFQIHLTCQGSCDKDPAVLKKNIEAKAKEDFDFVSSDRHIPKLVGEWTQQTKEEKKDVFAWSFVARDENKKVQEQHYVESRLIPGAPVFLECVVSIDDREPEGTFERLRDACKNLTFELATK
jgi:hypothetical protein